MAASRDVLNIARHTSWRSDEIGQQPSCNQPAAAHSTPQHCCCSRRQHAEQRAGSSCSHHQAPLRPLVLAMMLLLLPLAAAQGAAGAAAAGRPAGGSTAEAARQSPTGSMPEQHKPLVPVSPHDAAMFVITAVGLFLCAGAGMGGGPILVPVYMLLGGFNHTVAVALSNATMFAGCLCNTTSMLFRRHPLHRERSLISWYTIAIMEPMTLLGTVYAALLNRLLPSYIISLCITLLLGLMVWKTIKTGKKLWARESTAHNGASAADSALADSSKDMEDFAVLEAKDLKCTPSLFLSVQRSLARSVIILDAPADIRPDVGTGIELEPMPSLLQSGLVSLQCSMTRSRARSIKSMQRAPADAGPDSQAISPELQWRTKPVLSGPQAGSNGAQQPELPPECVMKPPADEVVCCSKTKFPPLPIALIALLFTAMVATGIGSRVCFPCGSTAYYLTQAAIVPIAIIIWLVERASLLRKKPAGATSTSATTDVNWNATNTLIIPLIAMLAGVIAGAFGLGGAMVKMPLLIWLNFKPQVAAATVTAMLVVTTASGTAVYAMMDQIPWDYAGVLMAVAVVSFFTGQRAIDYAIRRTGGRASLILFVMAGFFAYGSALSVWVTVDAFKATAASGVWGKLGSIC